MWRKIWETANNHQTGRWQWERRSYNSREVFPGYWLWGDAICVCPGAGDAPVEKKPGDDIEDFLAPIGGDEDP